MALLSLVHANCHGLGLIALICGLTQAATSSPASPYDTAPPGSDYASPAALAVSPDGKTLFIACATANQIVAFDTSKDSIAYSLRVPEAPLGLAVS
jgi:DNA-binding beta-propeller fold protein YncE